MLQLIALAMLETQSSARQESHSSVTMRPCDIYAQSCWANFAQY